MVKYLSLLPVTLVIIFIMGYFGYRVFRALHIPAPALAGAIVMVGILCGLGMPTAALPSIIKMGLQAIIGIMIGLRFSKERLKELKFLLLPGIVVTAWMVGAGLLIGLLLMRCTNLDVGTALFGAVPGGLAEMSMIAMDYNLNVPAVVVLQFIRLVGVYLIFPTLVSFAGAKKLVHTRRQVAAADSTAVARGLAVEKGMVWTLVCGGSGGLLASCLGVPAGGLIGAMVVVGILCALGLDLKPLPKGLITFAQIGLGGTVGLTFTPSVMSTLGEMVLPVVLMAIFMTLSGVLLGYIMHRFFGWDLITAFLACAPAGAAQMSAIALDMDADALTVGMIHALRLPAIIIILPPIITLLFL